MQRNARVIPEDQIHAPQLTSWASAHDPSVILNSHSAENTQYAGGQTYDLLIGVGAIASIESSVNSLEKLQLQLQDCPDWYFGMLSYDLKNELEDLSSSNLDVHEMPHLHFFRPETIIALQKGKYYIWSVNDIDHILQSISKTPVLEEESLQVDFTPRISRDEYLKNVNNLLKHIQLGDIYEANFCQEFYKEKVSLQPAALYQKLVHASPTPFAGYYRHQAHYVMCASPERYIQKKGTHVVSQPIKGTIKRGLSSEEDAQLKETLYHSPKDRSENVMIVDLVRNDLSRVALPNSVNVDELFGIYSFSNVHQMISTISCKVSTQTPLTEIIGNTYPMGSMTGAPKIKAMELIERYEATRRGIYSGAIGYISPTGDFDFNVVIRSLQYHATKKYLSYMVGGAITQNSTATAEYEECEIKAAAIKKVLCGM